MNDLELRLEEAKGLATQNKHEEACNLFTLLIEEAQSVNDTILPEIFNYKGISMRMRRFYEKALIDYESAIASDPDNEQMAFALINIADIHRVSNSDFSSAHYSLDEALTYAENGGLMHAKAVDQRGLVFLAQEIYGCSIGSHKRAITIYEKLIKSHLNNKDIMLGFGRAVQNLGAAYLLFNDHSKIDEAYNSQVDALKIFTSFQDQQGIVNCIVTMGDISKIKRDYSNSITQYENAWKILEETPNGRSITTLSLFLAELYLENQELEKATPYLERFGRGVINQELTRHDINLMRSRIDNTQRMYTTFRSDQLNVDNFKKCLD